MDVSNFFFSARGRGRGSPRRWEGGGTVFFFLKIPGGEVSREGAEGPGGSAANWRIWGGGGAKYIFSGPKCPPSLGVSKGPFRTKNSTESKFTTAREKRYGNSKTLRRVLRSACFFKEKKRQENGTGIVKTTAVAKYYGFGRRTIFCMKGPLGMFLEELTLQDIKGGNKLARRKRRNQPCKTQSLT